MERLCSYLRDYISENVGTGVLARANFLWNQSTSKNARAYIGVGDEFPMSSTTFQWPSFCFFQMLVYLP